MCACWVVDASSWCSNPAQESLIMKSSTGNTVMVCLNLRSLHSHESTHFVFPFLRTRSAGCGGSCTWGCSKTSELSVILVGLLLCASENCWFTISPLLCRIFLLELGLLVCLLSLDHHHLLTLGHPDLFQRFIQGPLGPFLIPIQEPQDPFPAPRPNRLTCLQVGKLQNTVQ